MNNRTEKSEAEVVVIGGGIVGCASAYYLARCGRSVVLLERAVIGFEASGRNAGGVRAQCRDRRERPLAMAAIKLWEGLAEELAFDIEYVQGGNIRLATNEARLKDLRQEGEEELEDGLYVELWDRDQLRRRAPYLADVFLGAKYCPTDGVANPILASRAFGWAARRAGVQVLEHTEAQEIVVQDGQVCAVRGRSRQGRVEIITPLVIHAGGPWSPFLSKALGVRLPVKPMRVVMAVTQRVTPFFSEFVSSHDLGVYARPAASGQVHIGGLGERPATWDKSVDREALRHLERAAQMIPGLGRVPVLRTWAGILAMTPDRIPIVGPVDGLRGYLLATGFSGHGFCLGPIIGKLLSEYIVEGEPSLSLDELRLSRFTADRGDSHED